MRKSTGSYPSLNVDTTAKRVVSHAGAVLLAATAGRVGLDRELSAALRPWMRPLAVHDPGKVLLDLAISVAIGGDCLADIAQVRSEPAVFGQVASDPTVSRLIDTLAADATGGVGRDQHGPGDGAGQGVGTGRDRCPRSRDDREARR